MWGLALGYVGCASTPAEPESEPRPRAAPASAPTEAREARQEVLRAEAERRAEAFRQRLVQLRAEEEARARARAAAARKARTGTTGMARILTPLTDRGPSVASGEPRPPVSGTADARRSQTDPAEGPGDLGATAPAGRSRSRRAPMGRREPAAAVPKGPARAEPGFGPTPRDWLEGARCLGGKELSAVQTRMAAARRAGKPRRIQAEWALALVELQVLIDDVRAELAHRGLANREQSCGSPSPAEGLLRQLFGPGAADAAMPDQVVRAALRVRSQLEIRAGLPRRKDAR
jgi:hypothetical protein